VGSWATWKRKGTIDWIIELNIHLRTKIIINDETLEQVSQFTYLGCSISYQFSNDVEFKLAKFLQKLGSIKRTIFKKVRTETILKIHNTLVLPTFLYGSQKDEELKQHPTYDPKA